MKKKNTKKAYSARVKKALKKLDFKKILDVYEDNEYVEVTVDRWGDACKYRIYDDGRMYER